MTTATTIESMDAAAKAVQDGLKKAAGTIDLSVSILAVTNATNAIRNSESTVGAARLEEIPHIRTIRDEITKMARLWHAKGTAAAVKDAIRNAFPVIPATPGVMAAVYGALENAGLAPATAKNLLALADKPALVEMVSAKKLALTAAYRVAQRVGMDDADYSAAHVCTVANVDSWLTARAAAKEIRSSWTAYTAAKADASSAIKTADNAANIALTATGETKANAEKERDAATETAKDSAASARMAWEQIAANRAVIAKEYKTALTDLDKDLARLVEKESAVIIAAAKASAEASAAKEKTATARAATARAAAQTAQDAANAHDAARATATAAARAAEEETNRLRAELEAAEAKARAGIKAKLDAATDAARAANDNMAKANAAAIAAKKDAATAAARADAAQLEATQANAVKTAAAAVETKTVTQEDAAQGPARPTATTYDGLTALYVRMDATTLAAEIAEIAAELAPNAKLLAEWAAFGRALKLGVSK